MKILFTTFICILFYNLAFSEESKSKNNYKTINVPSTSSYPMEMDVLTGVFGVYGPDVAHGLRSFGWEEYTGELKNDKPEGYGERKGSSNFYKGNWKNGKYHGSGVFSQPRSEYKYSGEWVEGLREGKGVLEYPWHVYLDNTDNKKYYFEYDRNIERSSYSFSFKYDGQFKNDLASGLGECTTAEYGQKNKPAVSKCEFSKGVLISKIRLPNKMIIGPVNKVLQIERDERKRLLSKH